jgi:hypothetical protein
MWLHEVEWVRAPKVTDVAALKDWFRLLRLLAELNDRKRRFIRFFFRPPDGGVEEELSNTEILLLARPLIAGADRLKPNDRAEWTSLLAAVRFGGTLPLDQRQYDDRLCAKLTRWAWDELRHFAEELEAPYEPEPTEISSLHALTCAFDIGIAWCDAQLQKKPPPKPPTPFQDRVLSELNGKALTRRRLESVLKVDSKQLNRDGLKPLREAGRIKNDRNVGGYYRTDAPPEKFKHLLLETVETKAPPKAPPA